MKVIFIYLILVIPVVDEVEEETKKINRTSIKIKVDNENLIKECDEEKLEDIDS